MIYSKGILINVISLFWLNSIINGNRWEVTSLYYLEKPEWWYRSNRTVEPRRIVLQNIASTKAKPTCRPRGTLTQVPTRINFSSHAAKICRSSFWRRQPLYVSYEIQNDFSVLSSLPLFACLVRSQSNNPTHFFG